MRAITFLEPSLSQRSLALGIVIRSARLNYREGAPSISLTKESQQMSSTEDRIRSIVNDNLDVGREPNFDAKLVESGVSSVDCIAFFKLVNEEFNLGLVAEECRQFETLRDLVTFIEARA